MSTINHSVLRALLALCLAIAGQAHSEESAPNAVAKEKYDPLAPDVSIAFKDTKLKEVDLPGVLHVEGESVGAFDPNKSHRISWGQQGIQTIFLSMHGPDLLVMPFNDPHIYGNSYVSIKKDKLNDGSFGNNVYIWFTFPAGVKPEPVTIFIEDPAGGPALGLQLMPKTIAQQVYTVVDDTNRLSASARQMDTKNADYVTRMQQLTQIAALGGTPSGYSREKLELPIIIMHGLHLNALRRLSNTEGDIYVYQVINQTDNPVTLHEKEFDGPRVRAVSIFPKPELASHESAMVVVFAGKPGKEAK